MNDSNPLADATPSELADELLRRGPGVARSALARLRLEAGKQRGKSLADRVSGAIIDAEWPGITLNELRRKFHGPDAAGDLLINAIDEAREKLPDYIIHKKRRTPAGRDEHWFQFKYALKPE